MKTRSLVNCYQTERKLTLLSKPQPKISSPLLIKMKISNIGSRISEQQKLESDNINSIEKGLTRRLLEKYKPKYICKMETILGREKKKRVA